VLRENSPRETHFTFLGGIVRTEPLGGKSVEQAQHRFDYG
jgi:hypothetical protein